MFLPLPASPDTRGGVFGFFLPLILGGDVDEGDRGGKERAHGNIHNKREVLTNPFSP
jgi:hypothetical protein